MNWLMEIWHFLVEFWIHIGGGIVSAIAIYYGRIYALRGINKARRAFHAILSMTDDIATIKGDLAKLKDTNESEHGEMAKQVKELREITNEADNRISKLTGQLEMFVLMSKQGGVRVVEKNGNDFATGA